MGVPPNRSSEPDLFSSTGRESSSLSPVGPSSAAVSRETKRATSSQHILPRDLDAAVRQLDDKELDKLVSVALQERDRRRRLLAHDESPRKGKPETVAASLPQGKLNAVRAAFKAGVTPARIAREFGLSRSDVQRALVGHKDRKL